MNSEDKNLLQQFDTIVIAQNYRLSYKKLVPHRDVGAGNPIIQKTNSVACLLDKYSIKIGDYSAGVPELMSYLKWGDSWTSRDPKELYSYQNSTPLNGIYLSQLLNSNGYRVVLAENFQSDKEIIAEALLRGARYVILSTTFITDTEPLIEVCEFVKSISSSVITILGGPFIYQLFNSDCAIWDIKVKELVGRTSKIVDYYVVEKRGEKSLIALLNSLEHNTSSIENVDNLVYYLKDGTAQRTKIQAEDGSADDLGINYASVKSAEEKTYFSLLTSRGCAFRCKFCTYHEVFPRIEYKSLEIVEQELKSFPVSIAGKRMIRLADDNFAASPRRLNAFCDLIIRKGFDFNWSCFASHHSMLDEANVKHMADAGCKIVFVGIESASQQVLDNMNKKVQVRDFLTTINNLRKHGIIAIGSFVIGFPGETEETIKENIRFIDQSGLHFYQLNLCNIFPTMEVYRERYRWGLKGFMYGWSHTTMDSIKAAESIVNIVESVKSVPTGGLADTSVQGCLEYLYSIGLYEKEIFPLYESFTRMLQCNIRTGAHLQISDLDGFSDFQDHYRSLEANKRLQSVKG